MNFVINLAAVLSLILSDSQEKRFELEIITPEKNLYKQFYLDRIIDE